MGIHQVLFTVAFIMPNFLLAHGQPIGHSHAQHVEQRIENNLTQVDEDGQRVSGQTPVYIYNNSKDEVAVSKVIQNEPTTFVQATPLSNSRAAQIRAVRKDMEVKTEEKIVEKLEESRIADEQKRAERLFGNRINALHVKKNSQWQQAQAVAPVVVQQPQPVYQAIVATKPAAPIAEEANEETPVVSNTVVINAKSSEVIEEDDGSLTVAQVNTAKANVGSEQNDGGSQMYFSPLIASVNHADAGNVESKGGLGVALGIKYESGLALEGSFLYSSHEGTYDYFVNGRRYNTFRNSVEIDQYNLGAAGKYYIGKNRLKPFVGGILSYTRRQYNSQSKLFESNSSNAFDAGLTAGADFAINDVFSVGLDYRYMKNISYDYDAQPSQGGVPTRLARKRGLFLQQADTSGGGFQDLEDMSYHVWMLTGKFMF